MERVNSVRVIGVGNPLAGDDAVGTHIVHKLMDYPMPGVDLIDAGPAGLSLLELLEGTEKAIIIDAVCGKGQQGAVLRFAIPNDLKPMANLAWESAMPSTHLMGLGEAITLGFELGMLPPHLVIFGVELGQTKRGASFSVNVSRAVESVIVGIRKELEQLTCMNFK